MRRGLVALLALALFGASDGGLNLVDGGPPPVEVGAEVEPDAGSGEPADGGVSEVDPPLPDIVAAAALPIHALWGDERLSESELYDRLAAERGVCFGESHGHAETHCAEARALLALSRQAQAAALPFALGFEMFQRPFQFALDGYVAGALSDVELVIQSEYDVRWAIDFDYYRALLERARSFQLPALALNARAELTRKIARTGLESLTAEERGELPELDLNDPEHVAYIYGLFGVLPGHEAESGLGNYYAAQTVWDETMADTASRWLAQSGDDAQIIVFAGSSHCQQSAIPRRITRRTGAPVLGVLPILASELALYPESGIGYDVVVVLEDEE
ncbi:MAG: ChaN family lipoprotein [Polyangiaceae bacterium]